MAVESSRLLIQHRPPWPGSRRCAWHGSRKWSTSDQSDYQWSPVDCLNNSGKLGQGVEDVLAMGVEDRVHLIEVDGWGVQETAHTTLISLARD